MIGKNILKRIGAGLMAGFCAFSMLGSTLSGAITASAADTKEPAFPSVDKVIAQAATLLGTPYEFGAKGYSGIYYQGQYAPLTEAYIRGQGIDCSGLVYYTMTHLGYKTSGFSFQNPVPVDTMHWLTVNDNCTITYNGVTAKIEVEKKNVPTKSHPYWEKADGSTITPGSIVVDYNPGSIDHAWIYMGEFNSRADVVTYLKKIGVPDSKITTKTVGDGKGDGGKHWRIESNGNDGVVINNKTDGKSSTAMYMSAFRITPRKVTFTVTKKDKEGNLVGKSSVDGSTAQYGVYSDAACKTKVATITIGTNGTGSTTLDAGTYYIKETKAPTGYTLDPKVYTVTGGNVNSTEDREKGTIKINKTADDGIIGDREFKVTYTEEGKSKSVTKKTDANGVAEFTGLFVYDRVSGKAISYTVSEINVDMRYVAPKAQDVTLTSGDADFTVNVKFNNELIKGYISIIKHSDKDEHVIENLEAGAEFDVYLKSAGSYANAKDSERDHLTTDKNGYAKTKKLPYGVYTVHQTKTVNDAELTPDFDVSIGKNSQTYEYTLNNKPFESYVKVVKIDSETGKTIALAGAGFEIYDEAENKVVMGDVSVFYTNDEGCLITPEMLGYGSYTLVEVKAPEGYVLDSTPVAFEITKANSTVENAVNVVLLTKENTPQKGRISVHKRGDVFSSVTSLGTAIWKDEDGNIHESGYPTFTSHFASADLEGAVFEVRAAEDIITADGTVRAKKGDVVATLTTDKHGYAQTKLLYLGKYTVQETKAPYGYVLNKAVKTVTLTYAGQNVNVSNTVDASFVNDYQGVKISLAKSMERDDKYGVGSSKDALRVEFGLYAAEKIVATDGSYIPKDGLVSHVTIGEDMTATIADKIPFGRYYVKEISTDEKYVISGEKYAVSYEYAGQDVKIVEINCGTFTNELKRGTVKGYKADEHDEPLAGAIFGIFDTECEVFNAENAIETTISDENGYFEIKGIPYGSYIVTEIEAPTGYVFSDDIYHVNIRENGDVVVIKAENKSITISISKQDVYGKELPGASMQLIDSESNVVDEWISDNTNHVVTKLPVGSYTLHEVAAPDGYVIATDIVFEVDKYNVVTIGGIVAEAYDNNGNPTIVMVDDTTKVHITKTDITGDKELEGAKLAIIDENGDVVDEWISATEPHIIEGKLTAGKEYTLREEIAPDGYVVANDITFTVSEDGTVDIVTMKDDTTKIRISKRDITTDKELPGAKLIIIDEDGNIVEEWISTSEPHYIEGKLIAGKSYTLREKTAPNGYEIANDVKFTVNEDGSVTEVVMYDEHTPDQPPSNPPKTGADSSNTDIAVALAVLMLGMIVLIATKKRSK